MKPKFSVGDRVRVYGRNMEEVGLYSARPTYGRVAFIFSSEENPGFMDVRYDYGGLGCVHEKQCRRLKPKVKRERMEWKLLNDKALNQLGLPPDGYEEKVVYSVYGNFRNGGSDFISSAVYSSIGEAIARMTEEHILGIFPLTVWIKKETK